MIDYNSRQALSSTRLAFRSAVATAIVLLSHGRVEATGTFEELRATSAEFARMVELGALT